MENTKNTDGIKRQAVVIIHGIGEQRPMDTLRSFVETILREEDEQGERSYYSKPDTISDSYELRRIKLKKLKGINEDWTYQTDFFEYYWAHHMSGTEWRHVFNWGFRHSSTNFLRYSKDWQRRCEARAYKDLRNHERLRQYFWAIPDLAIIVVAAFSSLWYFVRIRFLKLELVARQGSYQRFRGLRSHSIYLKQFLGIRAKNIIGDASAISRYITRKYR